LTGYTADGGTFYSDTPDKSKVHPQEGAEEKAADETVEGHINIHHNETTNSASNNSSDSNSDKNNDINSNNDANIDGGDSSSAPRESCKEATQSGLPSAAAIVTATSLPTGPHVQEDGFIVVQLNDESESSQHTADGKQDHSPGSPFQFLRYC
jgi:hypothetical protein